MIRVLYVDDEPALLEITRLYLEQTGDFSVEPVGSAREALERLKNGRYDVVLSDYQMPEMDGIKLLKEIRASGNTIPFIVFTGRGREEVVVEAINSGADSYIQKGGNPQAQFAELGHKIAQIVRRNHAEQKARVSEIRLRSLFENISDAIQIFDKKGRAVYNSPSVYRALGFPKGEPVYRHATDSLTYIHPNDRERVVSCYQKVSEVPDSSIFAEYRMRNVNGEYLWVESVFTNKYGVEGIGGLIVTTRTITERKRAEEELKKKHEEIHAAFEQLTATEEELRQNYNELAMGERRLAESERQIRASEAYLRCVISDVREGITAYDTDLRFTLWNLYMEELTGIPGADVVGKRLEERFPEFKDTRFPGDLKRVLAGETFDSGDILIELSAKKKNIWIRCIASPLFDHEGHITGVIGIVQDTTRRKEAELALEATAEALKESEEKYRGIFEAKNNPLVLIDTRTRQIVDSNEAARELYGYTCEQMNNMDCIHLSAEPEKTRETLARQVPRIPLRYHRRRDGTIFPADLTIAYCTLGGRQVMIVSVRDLTGVRRVDDALRIANLKLNLIIGVTRHDVLNSLTALLGYNAILRDRHSDPAAEELIDKQEKLLLAVKSHIEFTRGYDDLGVKAPVWQNVKTTAAQAYAQFINTIEFSCETEDLEIYADPMLEKVFYNLFDNAFRYGENVTKIRLYGEMDGPDLVLSFEDNGIGVPEEEKAKIFSRGIGKNTGLGLFLTREILAITRITIAETGEYRSGARFSIRVPRGAYRVLN
ncbi:PAS domain S-box protein [Methanoregula sp. UBA64]|uniref:PAS domain S-box protein n=1 Tax=Methanoregula sp. UBA64 TaxID=1915554 RepID=UPI0025E64D93|nr:PAS domain S-box protein [Methanoregula sp. UBA64]